MSDDRTTNPSATVVTRADAAATPRTDPAEGCLVVIYGDDLGRRVPLGQEATVVGRSSKSDVQLDQESVSRHHARIEPIEQGFAIRDLGSTNGTYVNDEPIEEIHLRDGDQIKIGRTIFKFIVSGNMEAQYHEEIYRLMTVDGLTELYNKRFFNEALEREASRSTRYSRAFCLIVFDLDHFKSINDTHGHLAGDSVLRQLGALVRARVRRDDVPARTGGEEFSVIVPETDLPSARQVAEKLRASIADAVFRFEGVSIQVTISAGIAQWHGPDDAAADLVRRADHKLYEAKRGGRNQVRG
ncbi:MAG: GGDEF domain-containing protein [Sandaracinaceae bacterium]